MLREGILTYPVVIDAESLERNGRVKASTIVNKLLKQLSHTKAYEDGYILAVTKLISIGNGDNNLFPGWIIFPVDIRCRIFTPVDGEVMTGIVHRIHEGGVFLRSGPMNIIFLASAKMPNYHYVSGENPAHKRDDSSQIRIGVAVRFTILAVRWIKDRFREFRVLASIDGDGLGPVSLNGLDGLDDCS